MSGGGSKPFTTHKVRAEWFQQRTSYPRREVVPADARRPGATDGPVWKEVGPPDIGGRLTSMAVDPANPDRIFVGAAGGGVWYSADAGRNWRQMWSDREQTLAIGSLAFDPHDSNILYAGTGEANLSGENYPGVGVFRTADGGATWTQIGDVEDGLVRLTFQGITENYSTLGLPRRIGTIAVNPADPNHIMAGGVTHGDDGIAALFETLDGGQHWHTAEDSNGKTSAIEDKGGGQGEVMGLFISPLDYYCHCVLFHPDQPGLVLATVEARGTQSGIWISRDGAKSWAQAKKGLPTGDQFGRTSLAVARGSKTIYALAGQQGTQKLLGVFRSDDLGQSWVACARGPFKNDGQLSYTNCIAMDPANPKTAILGSLELYKTTDGGKTWRQISAGTDPFSKKYVHRDHHALWIGGGRIYCANDGGFAVSEDGGRTWKARNQGLAIAMLYDVAVAPNNSHYMGCGMQDNGTWFAGALDPQEDDPPKDDPPKDDPPADGRAPTWDFRQELEGDGGWTCYDPDDERHVYASQQRMDLWRHRASDGWTNLDLSVIPDAERRSVWMAVVRMDTSPTSKRRRKPRAVYLGSNRMWRSLDDGDTWEPISDPFDGSIISAIEVAAADPEVIFTGTTNGGVFRSMNGGKTWTRNLAGPESPGRIVTRIATVPSDARRVFYTIGVVAAEFSGQDKPTMEADHILRLGLPLKRPDGTETFIDFHHIYQSKDSGENWTDGDPSGKLPNLPHNSVAVTASAGLFVAHDGGVANLPEQNGDEWLDITGNLPNIRITDLIFHERDRAVIVSTYGRGIWKLTADELGKWFATNTLPAGTVPPPTNAPASGSGKS